MNTAGAMKLRRKWIQVWHALRLGLGPIAMLCGILSFPEFSFFRIRCEVQYWPEYSMHGVENLIRHNDLQIHYTRGSHSRISLSLQGLA